MQREIPSSDLRTLSDMDVRCGARSIIKFRHVALEAMHIGDGETSLCHRLLDKRKGVRKRILRNAKKSKETTYKEFRSLGRVHHACTIEIVK